MFHGEVVTVESRPGRIGRTSLALEHRLTAAGSGSARLVATCRSTIVRYDYVAETAVPFSPELVALLLEAAGATAGSAS